MAQRETWCAVLLTLCLAASAAAQEGEDMG